MKSLYVFLTESRLSGRSRSGGRRAGARARRRRAAAAAGSASRRALEGQVRLEPVAAALAAEARLLVAAERRRRVEAVERVRPDDPRLQLLRHPEDPRALLRPDPRREPVRGVV